MNKILKIEALRGFVALYVAFAHIYYMLPILVGRRLSFIWDFGDVGVVIFFVISGFVIQLSYSRSNDKSFKSYFFKRFLRIYIPLILLFLTMILFFIIKNETENISLPNLIINLLMLQDIDSSAVFYPFLGNGPLWTLSFEWWYYMIFFVLTTYIPKWTNSIIYSSCIICSVLYLYYPNFIAKMITDMSLWWLGVEMAKLYAKKAEGNPFSLKNLATPLSIITLSTIILYIGESPLYIHLFRGLICILIGLLWSMTGWKGYNSTIGLFFPFGKISYSLYISHFPLIIQATYLDKFIIGLGIYRYIIYAILCLLFCYLIEVILYPILHQIFMDKFVYKYFIKKKIAS